MTTALCAGAASAPAAAEEEILAPVAGVGREGTRYRIAFDDAPIVLGSRKRVTLRVELPEVQGLLRPLKVSVNVGVILKVRRVKPGRYQIVYQLPRERFPQVAILALWRESGIDPSIAFFRLPLLGRAKIPIDAAPGASVIATVGGIEAAPVLADESGKVVLHLLVPPGETEARLRMTMEGQPDRAGVYPIDLPPFNRLTLAVTPQTVTADGKSKARILAYYDPVGRRRLSPKALDLRVKVGRLTKVGGKGTLLTAAWTAPPRGAKAQRVDFLAVARGDPRSQAKASIWLGKPAARRIVITTEPARVLGDGQEAIAVRLRVLDADGVGIEGLPMKIRTEVPGQGGKRGALENLGKGRYRFRLSPITYRGTHRGTRKIKKARITVQAGDLVVEHALPVEPWVPVALQVLPERLELLADGHTRAALRITVRDARGRPMRRVEVKAETTRGTLDPGPVEVDGGALRWGFSPPKIEVTSFARAVDAARVDGEITVRVGELVTVVPLLLTPVSRVLGGAKTYLEVVGGYGSNLGASQGPRARIALGTRLAASGRLALEAGGFLGGSRAASALSWASEAGEPGGTDGWMRLYEGQAGAELRLALLGERFRVEVIAAGGLGLVRLGAAWGGGDPVRLTRLAPALEGAVAFGWRLGPGRLVLSAHYARRLLGVLGSTGPSLLALEGKAGGLFGTLGYRLEL